ncbi:MAG: hypothetical protein ACR2MN_06625 [Acidimicrobiales bacterium]
MDILWHEFILNADEYEHFCSGAYGHLLDQKAEPQIPAENPTVPGGVAIARTFALACHDEGQTRYQTKLPVLFKADTSLGLADGRRWMLNCGHATCAPDDGARCVHHELLPLIPEKLPHQIPYEVGASYPAVNTISENQFGSYGTCPNSPGC